MTDSCLCTTFSSKEFDPNGFLEYLTAYRLPDGTIHLGDNIIDSLDEWVRRENRAMRNHAKKPRGPA
jgi:hypothetical protein